MIKKIIISRTSTKTEVIEVEVEILDSQCQNKTESQINAMFREHALDSAGGFDFTTSDEERVDVNYKIYGVYNPDPAG